MIKLIVILAFFSFLFSCETEETKYLYTEDDPEYDIFVLAASEKCITESTFFSNFDVYEEFDSAPFKEGDIYKISQDANNGLTIFVKVEKINPGDVTLIFNSDENTLDKVVTFEEADHKSLGDFVKTAVCNKNYSSYFSSISGLDSSSSLSFKWYKESILQIDDPDDADDKPEAYKRQWSSLTMNLNYPSLFYFYNGTKEYKYVLTDGAQEQTLPSKLTIVEVTPSQTDATDCDDDNSDGIPNIVACDFRTTTTATFPTCGVTIDQDAYKLRDYTTTAISYTGTNCKILVSGGVDPN